MFAAVYLVFQKQLKTNSFRRPGPARNRCVSGLGRDVFFGGRSRERLVFDKNGGVNKTNNDVLWPAPKRRVLHMCTDGKAEPVARIKLKPARAKIATANCIKVRELCMYVMI